MAAELHDRRRVWRAPGTTLRDLGPRADPDWLLTLPECRIVKQQRKVIVGRIVRDGQVLYIKRYNVFAWRIAVGSLFGRSPAVRAWDAGTELTACGIETPRLVAAVEERRCGILRRSFLLTREVRGGRRADEAWHLLRGLPDGSDSRAARRAFAHDLGRLVQRLHAARVYHPDLKDYNLLVREQDGRHAWVLLDLEGVRFGRVSPRRRVKNLMQLDRTIGRLARKTDRLRALAAYLAAEGPSAASLRRTWVERIGRMTARKERGRHAPAPRPRAAVSATIVCQNEARQIAGCLESVRWCNECVVVDGGSRDATVAIARRFDARVLHNPWPGHRAQKQFALDHAQSAWVLSVDSDERVSPELATEIGHILVDVPDDVGGYAVPRLVGFLGRWWWRGSWYPRPVVRLFRRDTAVWGGQDPHDRAEVIGRVVRLREPILHHSFTDIADHLRSIGKLTAVAVDQRRGMPRPGAGRLLFEPAWRFLRFYVLRRGALEGVPGLYAAAADAFYVFLRWACLWRARATRESNLPRLAEPAGGQ